LALRKWGMPRAEHAHERPAARLRQRNDGEHGRADQQHLLQGGVEAPLIIQGRGAAQSPNQELFCARIAVGRTPVLLLMGDEVRRIRRGNNNASDIHQFVNPHRGS